MSLPPDLVRRLRDAGVEPGAMQDPAAAWLALHARWGLRATLVDRYALEAAARGVRPHELPLAERGRLGREVMAAHSPGIEHLAASADPPVPETIELAEPDERWPAAFAAWCEPLRPAFGDSLLRLDHYGSTSIPGLAAKPVIDIQAIVRDVTAENTYVPGLVALGLTFRVREQGHRFFRPAAGRPRDVHLHVHEPGSDWERDHLLFRDYLRAHASAREGYLAVKREAAERYRDDRLAYTEAKTAFVLDTLVEAERWAAATGWRVPGVRES